ncbi:MAG: protein TolR [Proteobacteria bacterium]|nr:protein TolR [Pseudomonadota bacterium]
MAGSLNTSSRHHKRGRRSFIPNSQINVTPLVDVMLVLLIVFMVTAPMLTVGVPVDLPKTQAARMNDQTEPLIVTVNEQGQIYLQETLLTAEDLVTKLHVLTQNNPDAKIYVRGDQNLSYGKVMETMGLIAEAGFHKVSLIAQMPTQTPNNKASTLKGSSVKNQMSIKRTH